MSTEVESALAKVRAAAMAKPDALALLATPMSLREHWRDAAPVVELVALMAHHGGSLHVSVLTPDEYLSIQGSTFAALDELRDNLAGLGRPLLALDAPVPLQPVHIPKPWGQEIWFTGIEQRGVAEVGQGECHMPLPWLLAALPSLTLGAEGRQPLLLKILDPLPDEVYGDLYLEQHEEKREVYVVTHVDPRAWPEGVGGIRYGADPDMLQRCGGEHAFRQAFLSSIEAYEQIRREIDGIFDQYRLEDGIPLDAPVPASHLQRWQEALPAGLRERELGARRALERFVAVRSLRVGDVVKVPLNFPHSLLHGVRTVEFQTPVYERRIIAFAQKVLTQPHWDSAEAVAKMQLEAPEPDLELLESGPWGALERIVSFPDFEVRRLALEPGAQRDLPLPGYGIAMGVLGQVHLGTHALGPEQACLLPAAMGLASVRNPTADRVVILLATPA